MLYKNFLVVVCMFLLVFSSASLAQVKKNSSVIYVSPAGSDKNNGNFNTPFKTIQKAINEASSGEDIEIRKGVYEEAIDINKSGHENDYFSISNYNNEKVIIDGSDREVKHGQSGLINIRNKSWVSIKGLELKNFFSKSTDVPVGIYVSGYGDNITLENNHIHNIETHFKGCRGNALGIAIYGSNGNKSINNIKIRGNELNNLKTGCSESLSINGNVNNFLIESNYIHNNNNIGIDIIGYEGVSPNPNTDRAGKGIIRSNTIHHISSAYNSAYYEDTYGKRVYAAGGIYVDGGYDVLIEKNRIHHVDIGIELASEHRGRNTENVTVRNNVLYNNNVVGISIGGYNKNVGGTVGSKIINNTLYRNDTQNTWTGEFQIQHNVKDNIFKNNIMVVNDQGIFITHLGEDNINPVEMDYNLYYQGGYRQGNPIILWNGQEYNYLGYFQRKTGNSKNSVYRTYGALFDENDMQFELSNMSYAIDKGLNFSFSGLKDFHDKPRIKGQKIDIGATEF